MLKTTLTNEKTQSRRRGPTTAKHLSFGGRLSPNDCIGVMSDKTFAGASGGRLALWVQVFEVETWQEVGCRQRGVVIAGIYR